MQVVFTEDKLGLTLKNEGDSDVGDLVSRTVVKSAHGVAQLSNQIHVRFESEHRGPLLRSTSDSHAATTLMSLVWLCRTLSRKAMCCCL